jgi:hypothetical protein
MVTFTEGVLVPGQISLALSQGLGPDVRPRDKTTGVGKGITRGQICFLGAPNKFEVAGAGATGTEFAVATEDAAESDPKVHLACEGTAVAVTLSGATVPNKDMKPGAGGTGLDAGAATAGQICGLYLGHPKETDGRFPVTAGANLEVVYMLVRRR